VITIKLQDYISDGQFSYRKVREREELPDGRENIALYERDPKQDEWQYTPDLAYLLGYAKTPTMIRIRR